MTAQPIPDNRPAEVDHTVPQDREQRRSIRRHAEATCAEFPTDTPPTLDHLRQAAGHLLEDLMLPRAHLGFAMLCLSNAWWRGAYESVDYSRRLLLLPNCLRNAQRCRAHFDADGLHCAGCGQCPIGPVVVRARELGYRVHVAEGTPGVLSKLLHDQCEAVLGVACLDSLEKAFRRVSALGVPHVAVPLLADGCAATETDLDVLRTYLDARHDAPAPSRHGYLPLLRRARHLFEPPCIDPLLSELPRQDPHDPATAVALDWLKLGGKRFRPFITLAGYLAAARGAVTELDLDEVDLPEPVCRLAVAIEALHKASLVHDDIEDDDPYRYGHPTLHRRYGIGPAVNIGDYLVGLGYHLVASQAGPLPAEVVTDILGHLSRAHIDLCRGQGIELSCTAGDTTLEGPLDVLSVYALKTTPAFETALFAGLRSGGAAIDGDLLHRYSTWLGEAYQVLNDLDDWSGDRDNKLELGRDVVSGRPTVLAALARQAGAGDTLDHLLDGQSDDLSPRQRVDQLRELYHRLGVFARAERLVDKLRSRAIDVTTELDSAPLRELFVFLVRVLVP